DDVVHERIDDLAERGADDDADRKVHHVALYRELPELRKHAHRMASSSLRIRGAIMRERFTKNNPEENHARFTAPGCRRPCPRSSVFPACLATRAQGHGPRGL